MLFMFHVGWSASDPIIPDQRWSMVSVIADSFEAASQIAVCMTMCHPSCEMVTSLRYVE